MLNIIHVNLGLIKVAPLSFEKVVDRFHIVVEHTTNEKLLIDKVYVLLPWQQLIFNI